MGFKSSTVILAAMLAPTATAFVSTLVSSKVQPTVPQTSTTLYYRDDVPPIGAASKWDTPNDFDQFLTQCAIQSFTFLLNTMRDQHTISWLDEFTSPVYEKAEPGPANAGASNASTTEGETKAKVSLAEAAQAALLETEKDLLKTIADFPEEVIEEPSIVQEKQKVETSIPRSIFDERSKKFFPPHGHLTLLEEKIATKDAFAALGKAKLLAMASKKKESEVGVEELPLLGEEVPDKDDFPTLPSSGMELFESEAEVLDEPPGPPVSNTGIDALYTPTGLPRNQNNPPIVRKNDPPPKNHFAPYGSKPTSAPKNPFSNYQPINQKDEQTENETNKPEPKKNFSPFGNIPKHVPPHNKHTGGFMPVPETSPLYGGGGGISKKDDRDSTKEQPSSSSKKIGTVLKYHGLGILNNTRFPTSDAYFEELLNQPKALLLVESSNPVFPEIEVDIDPVSVCRRMVSVREQIAREFEHDLQVIADMGGLTLKSYNAMIEEARQKEAEEKLQQQKDALENLMPKSMEDSYSSNDGAKSSEKKTDTPKPVKPKMQRANLLFLERGVGEGDSADASPSPLRKGNFDLLCLLATQEAIHRVLNDPNRQARKSPEYGSNQFLQDFYVTRLLSHFSGDQRYGRADDFVEELLATPPRMITIGNTNDDKPDDGHEDALTKDLTYLVDPVKVAETILHEREVVALQWKQHVVDQARTDHRNIQNMILAKMMGSQKDECEIVDSEGNDVDDGFESCFE